MAAEIEELWDDVSADKPTTQSGDRSPSPEAPAEAYHSHSHHSDEGSRLSSSRSRSPRQRNRYNSDSFLSSDEEEERERRRYSSASPVSEAQPTSLDTGKGTSLPSSLSTPNLRTTGKSSGPKDAPGPKKRRKMVRRKQPLPAGSRKATEPPGLGSAKRELVALRSLTRRQEAELSRLRSRDRSSEAFGAREELRLQKEAIRQGRVQRDHLQRVLRERNDSLQAALRKVKSLEAQIDPAKHRPPPKSKTVVRLRDQLREKDRQISELDAKIESVERNFRQQMSLEQRRHQETAEKLKALQRHRRNVGNVSRTNRKAPGAAKLPLASELPPTKSLGSRQASKSLLSPARSTRSNSPGRHEAPLPQPVSEELDPPPKLPPESPPVGLHCH